MMDSNPTGTPHSLLQLHPQHKLSGSMRLHDSTYYLHTAALPAHHCYSGDSRLSMFPSLLHSPVKASAGGHLCMHLFSNKYLVTLMLPPASSQWIPSSSHTLGFPSPWTFRPGSPTPKGKQSRDNYLSFWHIDHLRYHFAHFLVCLVIHRGRIELDVQLLLLPLDPRLLCIRLHMYRESKGVWTNGANDALQLRRERGLAHSNEYQGNRSVEKRRVNCLGANDLVRISITRSSSIRTEHEASVGFASHCHSRMCT